MAREPVAGRPIRVLRVIARMNVGGPALQVTGLTTGMDPSEFEQRLLTGSVEPGEADYLELRGGDIPHVKVDGLGRSIRFGGDARAFATIVSEIRRFRPDIVHTHTAKAGVLGRVAARLMRVPHVVHTFHGHLLRGYFSPGVTTAVVQVERGLARSSDRLLAVGSRVRDELLAAGVGRPEQYVVVPPGVALPAPRPRDQARLALGLPASAPVVAFVGRLTEVKRPDRLLDVARLVLERHPGTIFVVVGEGPLYAQVEERARRLGDSVELLGWRADVETVYSASDLVLLTSDNEGMPVSLIEAGLSGRPSVTTDVGSAGEVVLDGETGLVVPVDAGALADGVVRLLEYPQLRERMGEVARRHTEARFSRDRLVRDTAGLYRSLVAL